MGGTLGVVAQMVHEAGLLERATGRNTDIHLTFTSLTPKSPILLKPALNDLINKQIIGFRGFKSLNR